MGGTQRVEQRSERARDGRRAAVSRRGRTALALAAVALAAAGCPGAKPAPPTAQTSLSVCVLDPSCTRVLAVGHRGAGFAGPEDTLVGFALAWLLGADAVEMDLRTSRDGALVLMHDATVDRTTDGAGPVALLSLAQLQALTVPSPSAGIPDGRVPTYAEALAFLDGRMLAVVDVKVADLAQVVAETAEAGALDRVIFLAASLAEALYLKQRSPDAVVMGRAQSAGEVYAYVLLANAELVHLEPGSRSASAVAFAHAAGRKVFDDALGPTDALAALLGGEAYRPLVGRGTDLIQTDLLPVLVPWLAGVNAP